MSKASSRCLLFEKKIEITYFIENAIIIRESQLLQDYSFKFKIVSAKE